MRRWWTVLIGAAVALPMLAYVAGTLAATGDEPGQRAPVVIEDATRQGSPTPGPGSTPTPTPPAAGDDDPRDDEADDEADDLDDDGPEVITPSPDDLDDHDDDEGRDDDDDDHSGPGRGERDDDEHEGHSDD